MSDFFIGLQLTETGTFYAEASLWCAANGAEIIQIEDGLYEIKEKPKMTPEELAELEHQRIQGLFMTKLDFVQAVAPLGITYADIKAMLAQNEEAQTAWELCNNIYRNNPFVEEFLGSEALGLSAAQIDALFDSVDKAKQL